MNGSTIVVVVLVALVVGVVGVAVGYLLRKSLGEARIASAEQQAEKIVQDAQRDAEGAKK